MSFLLAVIVALGISANTARAFTNGTLLPSYLCNDAGDGYPKSAGTLIPFLQIGIDQDNYNFFPPGGNPTVTIGIPGTATPKQAFAPSSRDIVGAFHNGGGLQDANGNPFPNPPNYQHSTNQPVWLAPLKANPGTGQGNYTIVPGTINSFVVAAHCPLPDIRGFNNPDVALDGFFAYAIDTATGERVGSWVNVGPTFSNWYACNPKGTASASVGIVHNQLVTDASSVANLTWMAPATIKGTIKFIGAGVSDCAFGPFSVEYNTTTNRSAPSLAAQGLNPRPLNVAGGFTMKGAAPDLPQAIGNVAGAPTNPGMMPQSTGNTAATGTTYTPAQAAGIGIGGAVAGALVFGGVFYFVGKKSISNGRAPLLL